jgi:nucleotide-binding universal stress UspA family protein
MSYQDILVPTDFAPGSRVALEHALASLDPAGARISVLHVLDQQFIEQALALFPDSDASRLHDHLRERAQQQYAELIDGLDMGQAEVELLIVEGAPFLKIVQLARELAVDLMVMAVHRGVENFEQFLFGSTAERVLRVAPCPVLIVPQMMGLQATDD